MMVPTANHLVKDIRLISYLYMFLYFTVKMMMFLLAVCSVRLKTGYLILKSGTGTHTSTMFLLSQHGFTYVAHQITRKQDVYDVFNWAGTSYIYVQACV